MIVSNAASLLRRCRGRGGGRSLPAPQLAASASALLRTFPSRLCQHDGMSCVTLNTADFRTTGRLIHVSSHHYSKSINDVHVTMESSGTNNTATAEQTSKCSQGTTTTTNDEEEMEQEEMFVIADPVLGLGNNREWGGPRRGGSMPEPTRFGDWERKGRCTDF